MLNYTDITQHTYVQSWTVTEIKAREECGIFCGSRYCTWLAWRNTHTLRIVRPCLQLAQARSSLRLQCKVLGKPKDNYDVSASVFVVQFNGFMSLTS